MEIRVVDDGGVDGGTWSRWCCSAGIDMALHLVGRLYSEEIARQTARHMEYTPATEG